MKDLPSVILNLPPEDTETDLAPPTPHPEHAPRLRGRVFERVDECDEGGVLAHWWLMIGVIEIDLRHYSSQPTTVWEWRIGDTACEYSHFEDCMEDLEREIRFLVRELGHDVHTQTGIDAYAIHLGQQAAAGIILAHETAWLEEYDRRRTIERTS